MDNNFESNVTNTQPQGGKGMAIASLICGILSLLLCCFSYVGLVLGIVAIVLGIISKKKTENGKGMALAGIITGSIGGAIALIFVIIGLAAGAAFSGMSPEQITQYIEGLMQ